MHHTSYINGMPVPANILADIISLPSFNVGTGIRVPAVTTELLHLRCVHDQSDVLQMLCIFLCQAQSLNVWSPRNGMQRTSVSHVIKDAFSSCWVF